LVQIIRYFITNNLQAHVQKPRENGAFFMLEFPYF
jgi:hypothetical protein